MAYGWQREYIDDNLTLQQIELFLVLAAKEQLSKMEVQATLNASALSNGRRK